MEDSEHINETVETYDLLIDSAIEQLKNVKNDLMSTPSSNDYKRKETV